MYIVMKTSNLTRARSSSEQSLSPDIILWQALAYADNYYLILSLLTAGHPTATIVGHVCEVYVCMCDLVCGSVVSL